MFIEISDKTSTIYMLDIHDTEIQIVEDRILLAYNDKRMIYPDCDCLLDWR